MIEDLVQTDFKAVDKRDELRTVFGYIRGDPGDVPLVLDGDKPYGVLNEKALVKTRLDPKTKIANYVIGTRTLPPDASEEAALEVLATSRLAHAPVARGNELLGYVRALDVLARIDVDLTADVLAREVPLLGPESSVGEAMHEIQRTGAPALPVLGKDGRLDGAVLRRDVVALEMDMRPDGRMPPAPNVDRRAQGVAGYVVDDVERVRLTAPFREVLRALERDGFAIVVDDAGAPRGLVTPEEITAAAIEALRAPRAVERGKAPPL